MPWGLHRYQQTGNLHFLTFSCYRRQPLLKCPVHRDLFLQALERMRKLYRFYVCGYVVMPEHVHLLLSEPETHTLADAIQFLKLSFSKRIRTCGHVVKVGPFWQKRYYDRNLRDAQEFTEKLRYLHRNPVKRGLVKEPGEWKWSSFRYYAYREAGVVEIESEWIARDREVLKTGGSPPTFLSPG